MAHASPSIREHARRMRRAPTRTEGRLWALLRDRRFAQTKFRRQVRVGPYILDFYCAGLKLAIEADGRQHESIWMSDYDSRRTAFLSARGITVLRIRNEDLIRQPLAVIEGIEMAIALLR